jgi:hypothetical protein
LAGTVLVALAIPGSAAAETFKVKNEKDSGPGSLRQAIADTNDGDLVKVPKGHYAVKSFLEVQTDIEIRGAGSRKTVVDGLKKSRVFFVNPPADLLLAKLAVTGGKAPYGGAIMSAGGVTIDQVLLEKNKAKRQSGRSFGAAIYSQDGNVSVIRSKVSHNTASSGDDLVIGGAIEVGGTSNSNLTIDRSEISDNTAKGAGGYGAAIAFTPSVASSSAELSISQSTIAGNRALGDADVSLGGVMYYEPSANGPGTSVNMTIENSTLANNLARSSASDAYAGGMFLAAHASSGGAAVEHIMNSTIAGNEADGALTSVGGGLYMGGAGVPVVTNTIVANNMADPGTEGCSEVVSSADGNLERGTTCGFTNSNDISPANPKLGKLKDNGGTTRTMALPENSPAVDQGISGTCAATDQRGVDRPQGTFCDIGAFELKQ